MEILAKRSTGISLELAVLDSPAKNANTSTRLHVSRQWSLDIKQEGLAVASTARDDPSTLPGMHRDHNAPACTATLNLKPKLAIMRQCTSVTDRRTDRRTLTS